MISVIIPTYKNKKMFLRNLHYNLQFLTNCQIIIVNDDPEESLKKEKLFSNNLKNLFLIENKKNLGFGQSINIGVKKAKYSYIMLLNNDVRLLNNNYQLALNHFNNNPSLFAVSFAQKEKDKTIVGKNVFYWNKGLFFHKKADNLNFGINAWAEGGACIIDKNKFLELGGFDPIYSPFYWEDIDLSYRAWKMGYQIIFEPTIIVEHHHKTTIGKYFSKEFINKIAFRNQLIFIWKNITDKELVLKHLVNIPKFIFISGFFDALKKLLKILRARKRTVKLFKKTDKNILNQFKN